MEHNKKQINLGLIFLLSGGFFLNLLARTVFSPLLLSFEQELGITHKAATTFFLFISLGYSIGMLLSGYVSSVLSHRHTIVTGLFIGGVSLFGVASFGSVNLIRFCLFILGAGMGVYLPSGLTAIVDSAAKKHRGKALSIHEIGPNLSFVIAPIYAQLFLSKSSWRLSLLVIGGLCILYCVVILMFFNEGRSYGERFNPTNLRAILLNPVFWVMTLFICIIIGATLGIYSILPTYLIAERGMEQRLVNTIVGLSRISVIPLIFLTGVLVDRFGTKRLLAIIVALSGITTGLIGFNLGPFLIAVVFIQPIMTTCFYPVTLTAIAHIWPESSYNVVISLMIPVSVAIGGGVVPVLMGIAGEGGSFAKGIVILGALILLSLLSLLFLKKDAYEPKE
ncbi:MAG: MFS transporter [Spirochaetota bacterium]|nr:MAG: MFS transporter [Spirochaetota bacterium]